MKITFMRPNMSARLTGATIEPLSMAILKAQTPKGVDLEFYDEFIEPLPESIETDLIAMTVQTFTAYRAYQLADTFRKKNIPVVMGGYHPTLMPDEALLHADAVVLGDAERIWEQVVHDAGKGELKKIYENGSLHSLKGVRYDRSIFQDKKYSKLIPVEFNRGCKFTCDFCSVIIFNRRKVKSRPVREVIEEIQGIKERYLLFVDDNICINKEKTKELLEAMIPLKKKWGCQIGIEALKDEALIKLLAKSGCIGVMVGFESLNSQNLREMNKRNNIGDDYTALIKSIKKYGIMIWGSFVLGYEHDDRDLLKKTFEFAKRNKLLLANFNTLNPMPGTALYQRLKNENRLLEEYWWRFEKYKYGEIMFQPKNISIPELKEECIKLRMRFNSYTNILYRAFDLKSNSKNISNCALFLTINMTARQQMLSKMREIQ